MKKPIIDKVDLLLDLWIDTIDVPTVEQVKLLTKLREVYGEVTKKRIDLRLMGKSADDLLSIIDGEKVLEEQEEHVEEIRQNQT